MINLTVTHIHDKVMHEVTCNVKFSYSSDLTDDAKKLESQLGNISTFVCENLLSKLKSNIYAVTGTSYSDVLAQIVAAIYQVNSKC